MNQHDSYNRTDAFLEINLSLFFLLKTIWKEAGTAGTAVKKILPQ